MKLTRKQERFILENYRRLSVARMARRLKIPVAEVRRGLRKLGLDSADARKGSGKAAAADLEAAWTHQLAVRLEFLNRPRVGLAVVVGLALALRLIHLLEVVDTPFFQHLHTDPAMYHRWAVQISEGDWLGRSRPVFYLGPLYPYFLAVIYSVFGSSPLAACVAQVVLSAASAGLVYHLGRRLFGPTTALIAGLLTACYGMLIFFSSLILGATLIIFLDLLMLALLVAGVQRSVWWKWVAAGVCLGLSAAARGNVVLFAPLAGLALAAYFGFRCPKKWLPPCLWGAGAFLVTISPLTLHNWLVGQDFVPLTANAGANFFIGNNAHSDGIYLRDARYKDRPMGLSVRDQQANFPEVAGQELGREDLKPSEISRFWVGQTLAEIGADWGRWVRLVGSKLGYLFNAYEVPNNRNYYFSKRFSVLLRLPLLTFGSLLPLALVGIVICWRRWREQGLLLAFLLAHSVALVAFFVNARYRLVVVAVLLLYAAAAIVWLCRQIGDKRFLRLVPAVGLLILGYVAVYQPVPRISLRANHLNLANAYRDLGQLEEALRHYDRALVVSKSFYYAYLKKGEVLARLGRRAEAREAFDKALVLARRNNDQLNTRRIQAQLCKLDGS